MVSYSKEYAKLSRELVYMQEWIKSKGLKLVVIFEGRDASGKGGVIKRILEPLNPRVCRVVVPLEYLRKGKRPNGIFKDMYRASACGWGDGTF